MQQIFLSLCLALSLSLGGCQQQLPPEQPQTQVEQQVQQEEVKQDKPKPQSEETEKIQARLEKVHEIKAEYTIKSISKDANGKDIPDTKLDAKVESQIIYNKDQSIEQMYTKTDVNSQVSASYVDNKDKKIYLDDGKGFKLYEGKDMQVQTESTYVNMVNAFIRGEQYLEKHDEGKYIKYSFKGKNGELLFKVDGLFNLGNIQNLNEATIDIQYYVNKDTNDIEKVIHKVEQPSEDNSIISISEGEFKLLEVNKTDKIPQAPKN